MNLLKRIFSQYVLPFQEVDGDKMLTWLARNQEMYDSGFRHWFAFRNSQIFELMSNAKDSRELAMYQGMRQELNVFRAEMLRADKIINGKKKKKKAKKK